MSTAPRPHAFGLLTFYKRAVHAFSLCSGLTSVISEITKPFNCGTNAFPTNACRNGTLYVPAGTKDLYIRFDGWRNFLHIEEGGEGNTITWYTYPATMPAHDLVVYEQETPSDVASARAGQATVKVVNDGVVIAHAEPQSRCVVYASNGQPVVSTVIEGDSQKIRLQKGQVYILTINGRTLKFAL